ncbi:MAG: hypothetical protein RLZZ160_713 [Actinomycetota bacterium]|jgi:hypothetical protein
MTTDFITSSREFRRELGFTSQERLKEFYKASDIDRPVNLNYIDELNGRLTEIVRRIDGVVHNSIRQKDIDIFIQKNLEIPFSLILQNNLLPLMTNQGRTPENVYYNWMRGHLFSEYFKTAIALIFNIKENSIKNVGQDDFKTIETFKRAATADLEIESSKGTIRFEMQSGFTGINDIKQHKWVEAVKHSQNQIITVVSHIDLFNGAVAFIRLDNIPENDLQWITRQQMEGQTVYNIDANKFTWKLNEKPPKFEDLDI